MIDKPKSFELLTRPKKSTNMNQTRVIVEKASFLLCQSFTDWHEKNKTGMIITTGNQTLKAKKCSRVLF